MSSKKRSYGTGAVYIKHGSYYGRWRTRDGGRVNRKLGAVRPPGGKTGLTHSQADKRLRERAHEVGDKRFAALLDDLTALHVVLGRAEIQD